MKITITINRNSLYDTLCRTTGYIGSKQIGTDSDAYTRVALTEGDAKLVDSFWQQARERLCLALRRQIISESDDAGTYTLELELSAAFDTSLQGTIQSGIETYFLEAIAAKWLALTDRDRAADYDQSSAATLDNLTRKTYCKAPPRRPVIGQRS